MPEQPTLPDADSKVFVADLNVGERVRSTFLLTRCDVRTRQSGDAYLVIELSDKSGQISGRIWEDAETTAARVRVGDYVWAEGVVDTWQSTAQLKVDSMRPASADEVDPRDYLPAAEADSEETFAALLEIVGSLQNEHLRSLLEAVFADPEVGERFRTAPGAMKLHHAYLGGLLEHTLSVVQLADRVAAHYPSLDRDLLVTGACLHDLGKIWELAYARSFDYTEEGRLVGHLLLEADRIGRAIDRIDGFPPSLRNHLLHLLAAHHGAHEHGAPVLPATPEALVLHYLDDLDSKIAAMEATISEAAATDEDSVWNPSLQRRVYRRRWDDPDD